MAAISTAILDSKTERQNGRSDPLETANQANDPLDTNLYEPHA
jgi:hypothetical protein